MPEPSTADALDAQQWSWSHITELPRCTLADCKQYKGGKEYKPYPTADYTNIGYDDSDLSDPLFKALVEIAADAWEAECKRYVETHGDRGTCVGGAGIAIYYRKPKCRKYERKLILSPPSSAAQGASTWEHCVTELCEFLKAHGIECYYHPGYMD